MYVITHPLLGDRIAARMLHATSAMVVANVATEHVEIHAVTVNGISL